MWTRWLLVLAVGCGRIGFDAIGAGDGASNGPDALGPLAGNCALWLRMDESAWTLAPGDVHDSCGTHDGTLDVATTTVVDSVRGTVGNFTGSQCVTIADDATLHPTTAVTLSAWVRPTALGTSTANGIISKRLDINTEHTYAMFIFNGDLAYVDIDGNLNRVMGTTMFSSAQWRQVTAVYDGSLPIASRTRIYLDGAVDAVGAETSTSIPPYTAPITVGCQPGGGPGEHFTGQLDEVIVWNRALSDSEVASWYTMTVR